MLRMGDTRELFGDFAAQEMTTPQHAASLPPKTHRAGTRTEAQGMSCCNFKRTSLSFDVQAFLPLSNDAFTKRRNRLVQEEPNCVRRFFHTSAFQE